VKEAGIRKVFLEATFTDPLIKLAKPCEVQIEVMKKISQFSTSVVLEKYIDSIYTTFDDKENVMSIKFQFYVSDTVSGPSSEYLEKKFQEIYSKELGHLGYTPIFIYGNEED